MEIVTYVAAALQSEVFAHGSLGDGRVGIADPAGVAHVVVNYNDINNSNNNNNNKDCYAAGERFRADMTGLLYFSS